MSHPSTVTSEPSNLIDYVSKLGHLALNSSFLGHNSTGYSSFSPNYLNFGSLGTQNRFKFVNSLSFSKGGSNLKKILTDFNRAVRVHCDRIPLGFSSISLNSGESNGVNGNGDGVVDDVSVPVNGVEADTSKRVLILMSDTGGGHRASAEAIKAAFYEEFGDDYQVYFQVSSYMEYYAIADIIWIRMQLVYS